MNKYNTDIRTPKRFKLSDNFLEDYRYKDDNMSELGRVVFKRTYARPVFRNGAESLESWFDCCKRVVEGTFNTQKKHCKDLCLPWDDRKAQRTAQDMFSRMYDMKWLPPGRGLWVMGTSVIEEKGGAALNNCGFCSTKDLATDFSGPFCFLMDMSMLGVGIGADTKGAGKVVIQEPKRTEDLVYTVEDSREGWVDAVKVVLDSYIGKCSLPSFDFSEVRPAGEPLKGFGGIASGPTPLIELIDELQTILGKDVGSKITSTTIVDIFNCIGRCVVSGGIRRTAEIMFGDPNDTDFSELKNREELNGWYQEQYELSQKISDNNKSILRTSECEDYLFWKSELDKFVEAYKDDCLLCSRYLKVTNSIDSHPVSKYRWASNNSILAYKGMDYSKYVDQIVNSGEPGFIWLENIREYSRMKDPRDNKDFRVMGCNPCGEQSLEDRELCCLVETFPEKHDDLTDYLKTLKVAYLYAKSVTLIATHDERTNAVLMRNRRIGCSMSGVEQAKEKFGINMFRDFCEQGYHKIQHLDELYSEWLCVPRSRKTTSVKPSGTVSLLAGATAGVHYALSEYYIKNLRVSENSPLVQACIDAGYRVEKAKVEPRTMIVSFPVKVENFSKSRNDVTIWEQFANAAFMQKYWSDNQVSITVTFKEEESSDILSCLQNYEDQLKSISLMKLDTTIYPQSPEVAITREEYEDMVANLKPIVFERAVHEYTEKFCDGEACMI